jgi:hypothetical protein
MAVENTTTKDTSSGTVTTKSTGNTISADAYNQMVAILEELTDHTHVYYDDYSTACNCNCACNRGTV